MFQLCLVEVVDLTVWRFAGRIGNRKLWIRASLMKFSEAWDLEKGNLVYWR